ncbi:hypothetical protein D3C75_1069220 [compost metagenome]
MRIRPRSVPACGSVRHIEPAQRPWYMGGRYSACKASLAWLSSARQAPAVSIGYRPNDRLAALSISSSWAPITFGMPMPP